MDAAKWASVIEVLTRETSTLRDRQIAKVETCREVARNLNWYAPADFRSPPDWCAEDAKVIQNLWRVDHAKLRDAAQVAPGVVGRWRDHVWNFEGDQAAKLQVIAWVLQQLFVLRDEVPQAEQLIDGMATAAGDLLVNRWKLKNVPMRGDYRQWAVVSTRRYDLLPKAWRYL